MITLPEGYAGILAGMLLDLPAVVYEFLSVHPELVKEGAKDIHSVFRDLDVTGCLGRIEIESHHIVMGGFLPGDIPETVYGAGLRPECAGRDLAPVKEEAVGGAEHNGRLSVQYLGRAEGIFPDVYGARLSHLSVGCDAGNPEGGVGSELQRPFIGGRFRSGLRAVQGIDHAHWPCGGEFKDGLVKECDMVVTASGLLRHGDVIVYAAGVKVLAGAVHGGAEGREVLVFR